MIRTYSSFNAKCACPTPEGEINPRAAHSYHYNYEYCFGTILYGDNLELAAHGEKLPGKTP